MLVPMQKTMLQRVQQSFSLRQRQAMEFSKTLKREETLSRHTSSEVSKIPLSLDESTRRGRVCTNCGKRIPLSNEHDMCNDCLRVSLFPKVKEFVRANDVNELEVAAHFGIDRALVRDWLDEGRLEHKQ